MDYRSHQDELSDSDNPLGSYGSDSGSGSGQGSQQGSGGSGYSNSMKDRIRGAENAAAVGKTSAAKAMSGPGKLSGGFAAAAAVAAKAKEANDARGKLKEKEGSGLYKPSAKSDDGPRQYSGSGKSMRRRLALAGMMSALVGGGGAFSLFGIVTGPFNILQVGELLKSFHLVEKEDQSASRTARLMRNIHYTITNQSEKTRMGMIGNHFANVVEDKMKAKGFEIEYDSNGKYTGYRIDPSRLSSADYPDLKDRNPQTVADYFKDKFGADVVANGDRVRINPPGGYFSENRLLKKVLRSTGLRSASPLTGRVTAVRMNIGLHRYKALINGQTLDEKYRAWAKERVRTTNWGKKIISAPVQGKDDQGNAATDETTDTVKEINDEIAKSQDDIANNKPGAKSKFTDFLKSKYTGGAASLLGLLCIVDVIASNVDANNYSQVIRPAADMGMEAVSLSDQTKDNKDVDSNQMGWWSDLLNDKVAGNWFTARSIQFETGHAMNGVDVGNDMKVDPNGNIATRIINEFTVLKDICAVFDGVVGIVITGVMALFAPIATGIQAFISIVFGPMIIDWIASLFTSDAVNAFVKGALRGGIMNYGTYWYANDKAAAGGGINQTKTDANTLKTAARESVQEEFESQNIAHRLFSPTDPKSFVAQVIQTQTNDPAQNVSNLALGILNTGKTFGSAIGGIFGKTVNAQAANATATYDYGFDDVAFAPSEMNAKEFENPYENAANAANILDANSEAEEPTTADGDPNYDNYIVRAKTCFGVDIAKETVEVDGGNKRFDQYTIKPPVTGQVPLQKDVVDKTHKCIDGSPYGAENGMSGGINDWTRIRMYIFDSQTANAIGCLQGSDTDPISKQACIDIGLEPDPNGGSGATAWDSSTGVPTCATTAVSSAPAGYTLSSCDDFEGTSLDGSTFTAYNDQGKDNPTTSGKGRIPEQCTVANSFFTLTQAADGATCGSGSSFNQQEGYWETRMRTKAIDGGSSSAHPVLILWPGTEKWADGELDYFETDIGNPAGGFLHCVGNPSANCYTIPKGGNEGLTPNAAKYADWLSYGLLWKPDVMTGFINGQQWWTSSDGSFRPNVAMHQTIQLDNLAGDDTPNPAQMQVDWVHVYCQTGSADCKAATATPAAAQP